MYYSPMPSAVIDRPPIARRLEAVPSPSPRRPRRAARAAAGERPPDEARLPGAAPEPPAGPAGPLPGVLRGVRVLVVDDDESSVELFAAALAACGADVVTASSAPDGLDVSAARAVDVVVSDIAMPGKDGYWFVSEMRRRTEVSRVPVIAVTAYGRQHSRARALAAGFADHLGRSPSTPRCCAARWRGRPAADAAPASGAQLARCARAATARVSSIGSRGFVR